MTKIEEYKSQGFSDEEIGNYISRKRIEYKAQDFSDEEIDDYFGMTIPKESITVKQEANSLLQRMRNYVGIPTEPEPTKTGISKPWYRGGPLLKSEFKPQTPQEIETDAEVERVLGQFTNSLSIGLYDLVAGPRERPKTMAGTIAGAGAELAGFIMGPIQASKFLLGSRLAPTASGLKGMAQVLAQGGATLGIASGLSSIIPSFLESEDFGDMGLSILKSTSFGALTGVIYPTMGVVPTQPLRMAVTLAVMDMVRSIGTEGYFTIDDFITGLRDGTVDKKELAKMSFGYLMDLYFAAKTPSMRTQLKSLEGIGKKIRELDPDEIGQTILDLSNEPEINARVQELKLKPAVQYGEKTYSGKLGESHVDVMNRNGLFIYDPAINYGYLTAEGKFIPHGEVISPLRSGEGMQGERVRKSLPETKIESESVYKMIRDNEGVEAETLARGLNKNGIITIDTHIRGNNIKMQIHGNKEILDRLSGAGVFVEQRPSKPGIDESYDLRVPKDQVERVLKEIKPELPFETTLKYGPEKEMAQAATEAMIEKGIARDPKKLMSEQLADEFLADPSKYQEITQKYGVTPQEFATILKEQASSWGRKLGELGLEAQRLGMEVPEIGRALEELERINRNPGTWDSIQSHYKSFDRIRRGLLVTQLSTSVRNFETQLGRVGLDTMEKALDSGLQKLLGKTQTVSPLEGVEQLFRIFQRGESKQITETILKEFPKEYRRMYSNYMSDIETGVGGTLSRGVDILNTANRFQEFLFRNGVFRASLEQNLKAQGKDLIEIIEKNQVGEIPLESIRYAVDRSLEMTFAKPPEYGTIGQTFVNFVNKFPGATFIIPFPRFMVNSLKFTFEYNPTGFLKFLSKGERTAFANGDMHVMSRAIIGTAMLGVAYALRDSEEYAGEKWYEINAGGKTIDLRPFNPFAAYLFMADVIHRSIRGSLQSLTSKDIVMGVLSANLRAGTGLYALDQILNSLSKTGDSEKALDLLKQFAGEVAGGFLTPLNQVKEFLAGFDDYVVKEKRSDPFWGPLKEKMPWLEKTLPELYSPTREGPVTREKPALRQLTGIMAREKTDFERELDRLGFDYGEIIHSTGNAEADNLIKQFMGIMASRVALPLVQSEAYQNLPDEQKALYLKDVLAEIREFGKGVAEGKDPFLFAELRIKKIPKRERAFYESIGVDFDKLIDQYRQMRKAQ